MYIIVCPKASPTAASDYQTPSGQMPRGLPVQWIDDYRGKDYEERKRAENAVRNVNRRCGITDPCRRWCLGRRCSAPIYARCRCNAFDTRSWAPCVPRRLAGSPEHLCSAAAETLYSGSSLPAQQCIDKPIMGPRQECSHASKIGDVHPHSLLSFFPLLSSSSLLPFTVCGSTEPCRQTYGAFWSEK